MTAFLDSIENRKAVQAALQAEGYYHGEIDGQLGPLSSQAISDYRTANKMDRAGEPVVDRELAERLGINPKALNPLEDLALRVGLKLLLNKLFPGKEIPMDSILATIKSAWASKINWTQVIGVAASVFVYFGIPIGEGETAAVIGIIQGLQALLTWYLRTYRTTTVTPAAAKAAGQ